MITTKAHALNRLRGQNDWLAECRNKHQLALRDLAQEMASLRKSTGMSLRCLADRAGFSPAYLSDIERGRRNLTEPVIEDYFKALGVHR